MRTYLYEGLHEEALDAAKQGCREVIDLFECMIYFYKYYSLLNDFPRFFFLLVSKR